MRGQMHCWPVGELAEDRICPVPGHSGGKLTASRSAFGHGFSSPDFLFNESHFNESQIIGKSKVFFRNPAKPFFTRYCSFPRSLCAGQQTSAVVDHGDYGTYIFLRSTDKNEE